MVENVFPISEIITVAKEYDFYTVFGDGNPATFIRLRATLACSLEIFFDDMNNYVTIPEGLSTNAPLIIREKVRKLRITPTASTTVTGNAMR